jgi:glycosyltransferase involved in cell wall biosynthesis
MNSLFQNNKICIIDHAGHTSQFDLAITLAKNNYNVLFAYTKNLSTPNANFQNHKNLDIIPLELGKDFNKYNYFKRIIDEIRLGLIQIKLVKLHEPSIVQSANNPLLSQLILLFFCKFKRILFINWITDLLGVGIKNTLKRKNAFLSFFVGGFFLMVEKICAFFSTWNITIAYKFEDYLKSKKIKNVSTILNWAPLNNDNITKSDFFQLNNLNKKKILLFSGTLGKKHSTEILFNISKNLTNEYFLVVITNPEIVNELNSDAKSRNLSRIKFYPFQPAEKVMHIFNSAFLLINILNDDSNFSVPSKVLSYIVAAKPIFLVMPEDNEISQMVIKNNLGVVVNHKDNEILLKKLNQLLKDQKLRNIFSNNCKKYSKDNFLSENKMNEFLTLYDILLS